MAGAAASIPHMGHGTVFMVSKIVQSFFIENLRKATFLSGCGWRQSLPHSKFS